MRRISSVAAVACAAWLLPGCGWKMIEAPIRVHGQVIDAGTKEPVEGACIDIADDREKLDIRLNTGILTDKNGVFDTTFMYDYERWIWFGIPVWWLPTAPERIYVEVSGNGYRTRVTNIEYRTALTGREMKPPPVKFDPITIHRSAPSKNRASGGDGK